MSRILFISYDGLLEDIGQSQILRYCERLAARHQITLLTCEKRGDLDDKDRMRETHLALDSLGIRWWALPYHKSPPVLSTLWDLSLLALHALAPCARGEFDLIHARSTPPGAVALALRRATGVPFIFDMKGFWADQRVETGAWKPGVVYRLAKMIESAALREARCVVSETKAAVEILKAMRTCGRFAVVPTCVDVSRFPPSRREPAPFTVGFLGSFGAGYLLKPMVGIFARIKARIPDARFRLLTRTDPRRFLEAFRNAGIAHDCLSVESASPETVPAELTRIDGGIYFLAATPAMKAVCPTKLPEFLAAGIPILTGPGIGDTDEILLSREVGVIVDPDSPAAWDEAAAAFVRLASDPLVHLRCRTTAADLLDVSAGVAIYDSVYSGEIQTHT